MSHQAFLPLKPSQFNTTVLNYPTQGEHLLYNTLSRALVTIDDKGLTLLNTLGNAVPFDEESKAFVVALQSRGFLVPQSWQEGERYLNSVRDLSGRKGGELNVTLLTNLQKCPLACGYCYQKGTHTGGRLEADLSDKAIGFICRQCQKLSVEKLLLTYYGSEPLSNPKAIFDTATHLGGFCRDNGIRFRFGMVTSGVLLTRPLVEKLVPLGFFHAQITIDGNRETHNASRPFQNGKGTYDTIMKNLEAYAGTIYTDVLCVLDESRVSAAYELIDTLAEKGLAARKVRMRFSPVSPDYSNETIESMSHLYVDAGQMLWAKEKAIIVEIAKLSIYAHERGLFDDLLPQRTWCAMQRHDGRHLVLEPNGTIQTCPTMIGRDEKYQAGHIDTGVGGIDTVIQENYRRSQQCLECTYLPICADCRVDTLQKTGDILAANSHEEEYDLIVPELVKGHYRAIQRRAAVA